MKTSLITILSSEHGRLRREQRDIDKRDLQRAVKYGKATRAWGQRWLIEYDGITFVTDSTMRREVTAYPSPLPCMPLSPQDKQQHDKTKRLLQEKPELATSHTVIVLDNSGSMLAKKNNIHLYRDSQNAAVSMTALEFVAEQLFNQTATNSDLISLVTFESSATIQISAEPIGWHVYNQFLKHRNCDRFVDRQCSPFFDASLAGSNFLPALDKAEDLLRGKSLQKNQHQTEQLHYHQCALSLFFFSDGSYTDHDSLSITKAEARQRLKDKIASMSALFGENFTVSMVGLGNPHDDFSGLQAMADAATDAGAKGSFEICNKTANSITSAISSLVSSTTETRTNLMEGGSSSFTLREDLRSEKKAKHKFDWKYYRILRHYVFDRSRKKLWRSGDLPLAAVQYNPEAAEERRFSPPPFLAINSNFVGTIGAERAAFRCRLSDKESVDGFVFDTMVAKETKHVERILEMEEFHLAFAETQNLAEFLANKFNQHLRGLPHFDPLKTPRIVFLTCSVLVLEDPTWSGGMKGVLVEKMLDTDRFPWTKWNDNNGVVDGKYRHIPLDVDVEWKQLEREREAASLQNSGKPPNLGDLGAIVEEEEEEDSDDDDSISDVESVENEEENAADESANGEATGITPSDYLQAFTHFTYRYTNKKVMVCDLQGVFNTETSPPTLELTDPAIHYASAKGRRRVFGRTDKGKPGMKRFFETHKCTQICTFLKLSARNKRWHRDWRKDFEEEQPIRVGHR